MISRLCLIFGVFLSVIVFAPIAVGLAKYTQSGWVGLVLPVVAGFLLARTLRELTE